MLQIKDISKQYRTGSLVQKALDHVSLNLRDSEFVAILGPSGSGKSTLLNIIGGLDRYDSGDLIINGVSTKKYKDRDWDSYRNHVVGFIFQSYNLIPHQTVLANVELALTISGISGKERRRRSVEALKKVGLGDQINKLPSQMSGGQMQRVAIARALVNDPDILLADEPTGALDTATSIQVMEMLKEVAKDRLVVMVTHNPQLAQAYATRIVNLKDGKILGDSNPYTIEESQKKPVHKNLGKSSMSFGTAFHLSLNNLRSKKARTALVSFAGSIGIIGIALVLAISNGVNAYIGKVEEQMLSEYPLEIQKQSLDMTSLLTSGSSLNDTVKDADKVSVMTTVTSLFSEMNSNDISSLKTWIDSDASSLKDHVSSIEYDYSIEPQIYRMDGDTPRRVNPDDTMSKMGFSFSSMMTGMSTNTFHALPEESSLYESQYDVKAGRWPENWNELVVVLTPSGSISDMDLYALGLQNADELDRMIDEYNSQQQIDAVDHSNDTYNYSDFLDISFRLVQAGDFYQYDKDAGVWVNQSDDDDYTRNLVEQGEELKVVGVVQPKKDTEIAMLTTGISYPYELLTHIIEKGADSPAAKAQLADPSINIFTGKPFGEENEDALSFSDLISVDENKMQSAFSIDPSRINLSSIGLHFNADAIENLLKQTGINLSKDAMEGIMQSAVNDWANGYALSDPLAASDPAQSFRNYLSTPEAAQVITDGVNAWSGTSYSEEQLQEISKNLASQIEYQVRAAVRSSIQQIAAASRGALRVNSSILSSAISLNRSQEQLESLLSSMMTSSTSSLENNLSELGYADLDNPSSISIYPKTFEDKNEVLSILEDYNQQKKDEGNEEQAVAWTDMVGTMMSSITKIINTITYVLVAFIAISLVVSSIMIGVITYISVLERRKEIGILRAIGASRHNVAEVFNAETFITGLLSGAIGIGITLLLLLPTNIVIHKVTGVANMNAALKPLDAVGLIALSVGLTLLGGLIPSSKAAKSDPVAALRTD